MLPVSSWPPGIPGASLSPFAKPRAVNVGPYGYVIPKGAWIVNTMGNSVVMYFPTVDPWYGVSQTPGAGLPSAGSRAAPPRSAAGAVTGTCGPPPPCFRKHDTVLEDWRAWQRKTGQTDPPIRPTPGRRPPNWFGWNFVGAPFATLVYPGTAGLVVADGQNVVITGGGCATITEAYSV